MKSLHLLSACGLALVSAACAPGLSSKARVALDCPPEQGDLKLANVSPDKKTCAYTSRDGDEVSLRLIPVSTNYEAALQPIEQELQSEQQTAAQAAEGKASAAAADAKAIGKAGGASATAASEAAKQAADDALGGLQRGRQDRDRDEDDNVSIGTNGIHVTPKDGRGDHADINLPGIHISADDDKANVSVAGVNVDAGEDGATVRMARDVRLRGEAFSPERRGFRATYILAKDNLKDGWKAVGYEAAGPKTGPIIVGVFKAHEGRHHHGSDDVRQLVRRNAGV